MERAVFFDRDNTLIANDGDLGDPELVGLLDGAARGIARLNAMGFRVVVVTNQGGVARGHYGEEDVVRVHARIAQVVLEAAGGRIDRFYFCPFHPEAPVERYRGDHPWRKPHPGMLLRAGEDMNLDLSRCWTIGDQARDMRAGRTAGTRTILIPHAGASRGEPPDADFVVRDLTEAVGVIASNPSL